MDPFGYVLKFVFPEDFLRIPLEARAGITPEIVAGILAGLSPEIYTGIFQGIFQQISVGFSSIFFSGITPWIRLGVYPEILSIFPPRISSGVPAGVAFSNLGVCSLRRALRKH